MKINIIFDVVIEIEIFINKVNDLYLYVWEELCDFNKFLKLCKRNFNFFWFGKVLCKC